MKFTHKALIGKEVNVFGSTFKVIDVRTISDRILVYLKTEGPDRPVDSRTVRIYNEETKQLEDVEIV